MTSLTPPDPAADQCPARRSRAPAARSRAACWCADGTHRAMRAASAPAGAPRAPRSSIAAARCWRPAWSTCAPSSASRARSIARRSKSAGEAAAAGGVTTIVCMPDTDPVIDDPAIVDFVLRRARDTAIVHIRPAAALTKGLHGAGDDRDRPAAGGRRGRLHRRRTLASPTRR